MDGLDLPAAGGEAVMGWRGLLARRIGRCKIHGIAILLGGEFGSILQQRAHFLAFGTAVHDMLSINDSKDDVRIAVTVLGQPALRQRINPRVRHIGVSLCRSDFDSDAFLLFFRCRRRVDNRRQQNQDKDRSKSIIYSLNPQFFPRKGNCKDTSTAWRRRKY